MAEHIKWYVGIGAKDRQRSYFGEFARLGTPTAARFPEYSAVIGPFRTKRGAMFAAENAWAGPTVAEYEDKAERAARQAHTYRPQRLYGVFWTEGDKAMWGLHRNGKQARKIGKARQAIVLSMPLPGSEYGAWDAPTFRVSADRTEVDYRPKG